MTPVTLEDVARYLAGEIDDAAERQRIEQARESDTLVGAWFDEMEAEIWQQLTEVDSRHDTGRAVESESALPSAEANVVASSTVSLSESISSDNVVLLEFPQFALAAATGALHVQMHGGPWDAELVEAGRQIVLDLRAVAEKAPFALARYTIFGPATRLPRPIISDGWLTLELTESGQHRQGRLRISDFVLKKEIGQCAYRLELITEANRYLVDPVTLKWLIARSEDREVRERLQQLVGSS